MSVSIRWGESRSEARRVRRSGIFRDMKRKTRKCIRGFSLGEVLLAISVLIVGILPVFTSLSKGYEVTALGRQLIVASGLAQEGVELIQNVRNNYVLGGSSSSFREWLPADAASTGTSTWTGCRVDIDDSILDTDTYTERIDCSVGGSEGFDLTRNGDGLYTHSDTSGSFQRRVLMEYDADAETLVVVSVVSWGDVTPVSLTEARSDCMSEDRCVYAETKLSPWR